MHAHRLALIALLIGCGPDTSPDNDPKPDDGHAESSEDDSSPLPSGDTGDDCPDPSELACRLAGLPRVA